MYIRYLIEGSFFNYAKSIKIKVIIVFYQSSESSELVEWCQDIEMNDNHQNDNQLKPHQWPLLLNFFSHSLRH
jgi:hypothetical protein